LHKRREQNHRAERDVLLNHLTAAEPDDTAGNDASEAHVKGVVEDLEIDCAELVTTIGSIEPTVFLDILILTT